MANVEALSCRGAVGGAGASRDQARPWFESWLLSIGPARATAVLIGGALFAGFMLHLFILAFAHPLFNRRTLISALIVMIIIAGPVVFYSQILIRRLAQSRSELRTLSDRLAGALDEAKAADTAKLRFFANANHELRTPLNAILGFSEMLEAEMLGPLGQPRYREYARDIHHSATHLLELVNDLLDLTGTVARGREVARDDQCDVPQIIGDVLHTVSPAAEREGIQLNSRIAPAIHGLRANERMLKQILLNLLSNAIKFSPGGAVTINAQLTEGGDLSIAVADNGIGMSQSDIAIAMTPFGQVDNAMTRRHSGTGLGLPLVKAMMEIHDGFLSIDSELGHGTTVTLRFPTARMISAPAVAPAVVAPALKA